MAPKIEKITDIGSLQLGEGPHWDAETQSLYFVDLFGQYIHKYVPSTRKHTKVHIGENVSLIIPVRGKKDQLLITIGRKIALVTWDGESEKFAKVEILYEVDENTENVFNDGKCDPSGRLWAGTLPKMSEDGQFPVGKCNFFSFQNKKIVTQIPKIGLSNGLAFDTTLKKFYYVDSLKGTLDQYDFDIKNGTISNGKPIFTLIKEDKVEGVQVLDGMTIDTDGNLWVAVFNQAKVLKIDPRKPETVLETIHLPARQTTSVAFGGPNLDELYITTGSFKAGMSPTTPDDGFVYKVTGLNAKGLPGDTAVL